LTKCLVTNCLDDAARIAKRNDKNYGANCIDLQQQKYSAPVEIL